MQESENTGGEAFKPDLTRRSRSEAIHKLDVTVQALLLHGTTEDFDAACAAVARVASKAMRRR